MTAFDEYRKTAADMLHRWGRELEAGESRPNTLALIDHVRSPKPVSGGMPPGGAMFSPHAEQADKLLHEIRLLDPGLADYLVAFALRMSLAEMSSNFGGSKATANIRLECAMSAFAMALYCRVDR